MTKETRAQIIQRVYDKFSTEIKSAFDGDVDPSAWIGIVSEMMALMKKIKVCNQDKKKILIEVIKSVITTELPDDKRDTALSILDTVVSPGIDLAASFNKATLTRCLKMCC